MTPRRRVAALAVLAMAVAAPPVAVAEQHGVTGSPVAVAQVEAAATLPGVAEPAAVTRRQAARSSRVGAKSAAARRAAAKGRRSMRVGAKSAAARRAAAKRRRSMRMRWRAAASALRVAPPGVLLGGSTRSGPTTPGPQPGAPTPIGPGTTPAPPTPIHTLSVATREYSLTLSRQVLTPGLETIQLQNRGEDPHDLVISPDDGSNSPLFSFPEVPSLESHTEKVQLAAGRYKLFCSLPGHEALGMRATLRVE